MVSCYRSFASDASTSIELLKPITMKLKWPSRLTHRLRYTVIRRPMGRHNPPSVPFNTISTRRIIILEVPITDHGTLFQIGQQSVLPIIVASIQAAINVEVGLSE